MLDLFLTNVPPAEIVAGVIGVTISDHQPISMLTDVDFNLKKYRAAQTRFKNSQQKSATFWTTYRSWELDYGAVPIIDGYALGLVDDPYFHVQIIRRRSTLLFS